MSMDEEINAIYVKWDAEIAPIYYAKQQAELVSFITRQQAELTPIKAKCNQINAKWEAEIDTICAKYAGASTPEGKIWV
jgi:prefoldin subunit 5